MDREFYQWLQTLVCALQLPEWGLEGEISRNEAFAQVANYAPSLGVELKPSDPKFLPTLLLRLNEILAGEKEPASLPENLKELVDAYEEHLEKRREDALKTAFKIPPEKEVDQWIKKLYQNYRQEIQTQIVDPEESLANNPLLRQEISHQITIALAESLPPTARREGPGSLSEDGYRESLEKLRPFISQQLRWAAVERPKIETDKNIIDKTARTTLEEAKITAFAGRHFIPVEKLLVPAEKKTAKKSVEEIEKAPWLEPTTRDLTYLNWQPSGSKVPLGQKAASGVKKVFFSPFAKPVQWLADLAPEEAREKQKTLTYLAKGYTPRAIDQTLKYLYEKEPKSPQIPFWQGMKVLYKTEKPPFQGLFEHYYQWNTLGKKVTKIKTIPSSRIARIVTFGRFENFASLRGSFWKIFKGTKIGGFLSKSAGKILVRLGKFASALSGAGTAMLAWDTFKKGMKAAGAYLFGLLLIAAHYGPAAVTGTLIGGIGGGIVGGIIGFKIGGLIGVAIGGPLGMAVGGTIGFLTGVLIQFVWDKITAAASTISLPQIGTSFLSQTGMATVSTAKWFIPVAATTSIVGGITVSIIASSAFVIPAERRPSPWAGQSDYIRVEKTVAFAGEINPDGTINNSEIVDKTVFTYQFTITATTATLINITAEDVITTTQESGTNQIETKVWPDIPDLTSGESWTSEPYDILTRPVNKFTDSILSNMVTVSADVEEENLTGEQSFASTTVTIGSPPQDCPRGWPVNARPLVITQGPNGSFSHPGLEAIDIGRVGNTTPVTATHKGIAHIGEDTGKGRYVSITSTCKGITFNSLYAHLGTILVDDGKPVIYGEQIGITDNTGVSTGPHLHYEFKSSGNQIKMAPLNIPASVPYGNTCTDSNPCVY